MKMRGSGLRIVCAGTVAADARHGGAAWAVFQYLLGLRQLGHDVWFIEPIPRAKLRPLGANLVHTAAALRFQRLMAAFGFRDASAMLVEGTTDTVGLAHDALRRVAVEADLLVNISGVLEDEALLAPIRRRLYLDFDPGFTQVWASEGVHHRFDAHTHFATVGLCVGRPGCHVPTCGRTWIPTLPPVVLTEWPFALGQTRKAFTTVANWRSHGSLQYDGLFLGQKAHSLRPLIDLPKQTPTRFDLALKIHRDEPDLAALKSNRWNLIDPGRAAGTPGCYRQFVSRSHAEFGIAKSGYVTTRSGWVSDRSACYLASGRPVLAQDTGFSSVVPAGEGLLRFESRDEAIGALERIEGDYARHRHAARALAEEYFDSRRALTRLLDRVGASA
jgi:hypothetical protein